MKQLVEYMNENLNELIFELKSQTYLNAAKKAKKIGDPRVEKFLQAFNDNVNKELMNAGDPDDIDKKLNIYYNADKKSIVRLKSLHKNNNPDLIKSKKGSFLAIQNDDLDFIANVFVVGNKDKDRQIFLRQSIISEDNWDYIAKRFDRVAEKINDLEAKKPFTFVELFTNTSCVEFFYIIDTDNFIPTYLMYKGVRKYDEYCLDYYSEDDKVGINAICKAMNQNHKDI